MAALLKLICFMAFSITAAPLKNAPLLPSPLASGASLSTPLDVGGLSFRIWCHEYRWERYEGECKRQSQRGALIYINQSVSD